MRLLTGSLPADAPGSARLAHFVLNRCEADVQHRALNGQVNDRRIRVVLADLEARGIIPFVPSRRDMRTGVAYLARTATG